MTVSAKSQAGDFAYTNVNGAITITGYIGQGGNVNIPSMIDGLPVTSIGDSAFSGVSRLTGVAISDSVTNLGGSAFLNCSSLTSVSIGKGITSISGAGFGTFMNCSSLASITIPDNVISITDGPLTPGGAIGAFNNCISLTNVIIGKGLTYLGVGAFSYCSNLTGVYFQGNAPTPGTNMFGEDIFHPDNLATLYYLPGTTGWSSTYASRPTLLWNPQFQSGLAPSGSSPIGFNIIGTAGIPLVVEATTDLANPWTPLLTITLANGYYHFSDPLWSYYPRRFYRIRSP